MTKLTIDSTIKDLLEHLGIDLDAIYDQGYNDGWDDGQAHIRMVELKKRREYADRGGIDYYQLGYADGKAECEIGFCYDDDYVRGYWDDENIPIDADEYARGYKDGWNYAEAKKKKEEE